VTVTIKRFEWFRKRQEPQTCGRSMVDGDDMSMKCFPDGRLMIVTGINKASPRGLTPASKRLVRDVSLFLVQTYICSPRAV
jgi:hypothetical protein